MRLKAALSLLCAATAVIFGLIDSAGAVGRSDFNAAKDPTTAIRRVIEQQLSAIKRDDAETAFSLAAPNIRHAFRDPSTFMALVTKDYTPMRRWEAATFLDLRTFNDHVVQRVKLIDNKGSVHVANYAMIKADTGEWWVAGVAIEDKAKDKPTDATRTKAKAARPPE